MSLGLRRLSDFNGNYKGVYKLLVIRIRNMSFRNWVVEFACDLKDLLKEANLSALPRYKVFVVNMLKGILRLVAPLIIKDLEDPIPNHRAAIADILTRVPRKKAMSPLIEALKKEKFRHVCQPLFLALGNSISVVKSAKSLDETEMKLREAGKLVKDVKHKRQMIAKLLVIISLTRSAMLQKQTEEIKLEGKQFKAPDKPTGFYRAMRYL